MSSGVRMSSGVFCRASCFFLNFFITCFLILLLPAMLICSHILFFPSIPNLQDTLKAAFQTYAPVKDRDTTGVYRDAVRCCEMLWDAWKLESFKKHTHREKSVRSLKRILLVDGSSIGCGTLVLNVELHVALHVGYPSFFSTWLRICAVSFSGGTCASWVGNCLGFISASSRVPAVSSGNGSTPSPDSWGSPAEPMLSTFWVMMLLNFSTSTVMIGWYWTWGSKWLWWLC